jgi:uncharacterized membrane protein
MLKLNGNPFRGVKRATFTLACKSPFFGAIQHTDTVIWTGAVLAWIFRLRPLAHCRKLLVAVFVTKIRMALPAAHMAIKLG